MQVYLPLIFKQANLNINVARICAEKKALCTNGVKAVYGPVPMATWCEALWEDTYCSMGQIAYVVSNVYNVHNIGVYFEFTNTMLSQKELEDRWCNQLLNVLCSSTINGVIVASKILEDYIRGNYPLLDVIVKQRDGNYSRHKQAIPLLNQFEKEVVDNSERTLNYASPRISRTYAEETFYERQRTFVKREDADRYQECFCGGHQRPTLDLVESYVYYLANPEHEDAFRFDLLASIYNDSSFEFELLGR